MYRCALERSSGPWSVWTQNPADGTRAGGREVRQRSNTRHLIFDIPRLVEYASSFMTLYPGDVIMTGTPEGVGPVRPGDTMHAWIEGIGEMSVPVRAHPP